MKLKYAKYLLKTFWVPIIKCQMQREGDNSIMASYVHWKWLPKYVENWAFSDSPKNLFRLYTSKLSFISSWYLRRISEKTSYEISSKKEYVWIQPNLFLYRGKSSILNQQVFSTLKGNRQNVFARCFIKWRKIFFL